MKNLILITLFTLFSFEGFAQDIDPNYYYRLTTSWQGDGKSLDIINEGENNKLILANTDNYSGQMWKLTPIKDGYYRMTTAWQGDGKSLDIINDGENNKPILTNTGNYSGQMWKITPVGRGFNRLTTAWQGDGKSLDIINDGENNKPILANTGNYSGQFWKLTKLAPIKKAEVKPVRKPATTRTTVSTKTKTVEKSKPTRRVPKAQPAPTKTTSTERTNNTKSTAENTNTKPTSTPTSNVGTLPTPTTAEERIEVEIFQMVNAHRLKMGLPPYKYDPIIRRYSREHSQYMKAQGTISHDTFKARMKKLSEEVGGAWMRGENVALNSSAKGAFDAWLNSSGHRANIEKDGYTHATLGVVSKGGGMYYLTHIFVKK